MDTTSALEGVWQQYLALPVETRSLLAAIAALTLVFHIRFTQKTVNYGPTILTTMGIFATFLGIALGLFHFDPEKIQESVPALLSGLKTAFWASVAGVGGALTLKFRDFVIGPTAAYGDHSSTEVTATDIYEQLRVLNRALVGNDDTSLISQLKLVRQDTNDRLDAIKTTQVEALSKLSEMGSRALIEALREVIRDFNVKISEQFGDNFKELNAAVGQLLIWQGQYKQTVETTAQKLDAVTALMAKASENYATLVERSGAFTKIAEELGAIMAGLEAERQQIGNLSERLGNLLTAASGSLPEVERKIVELVNQLANAFAQNQQTMTAAINENITVIRATLQSSQQNLADSQSDFSRQIADLVSKTKEQVATLDAALSEELTKSLQSLGQQLSSLSEKFVADYGPLTERLRRVVEMARG